MGNESAAGCLTVQVESTPPNLEITCPTMVAIGAAGVNATVTASDSYSGLKTNPSGTVPINTSTSGLKTVTETAVSNVGTEVTKSCSTFVGYYTVINGPVNGKLLVRNGEAVKLGPAAKVKGTVTVRAGGALDVEGATLSGALSASKAALVRICGASIAKTLKVASSAGTLGDRRRHTRMRRPTRSAPPPRSPETRWASRSSAIRSAPRSRSRTTCPV